MPRPADQWITRRVSWLAVDVFAVVVMLGIMSLKLWATPDRRRLPPGHRPLVYALTPTAFGVRSAATARPTVRLYRLWNSGLANLGLDAASSEVSRVTRQSWPHRTTRKDRCNANQSPHLQRQLPAGREWRG